jgi:hypothetical protein
MEPPSLDVMKCITDAGVGQMRWRTGNDLLPGDIVMRTGDLYCSGWSNLDHDVIVVAGDPDVTARAVQG